MKPILLVFCIGFSYYCANAQSSCHSIYSNNQQLPAMEECTARVNSTTVFASPPDAQKMTLWCWAASLSLIYTAEGHPISQEQIISQNINDTENPLTGNFLQSEDRINRVYTDANGKKFTSMSMQVFSTEDVARSLSEGFPVLMYNSINHHAFVQTSMTYWHFFTGGFKMTSGIFWDPQPGYGYGSYGTNGHSSTSFSDADFYGINVNAWSIITR
jgi:hypothetical protein